jgi:hypothetical protein
MKTQERINLTRQIDKQVGLIKNKTLQEQQNDRDHYIPCNNISEC